MLQAQSKNGELVTLATLTEEEIKEKKGKFQFYCPVCEEPLIIKAGQRVVPHFAHYPKSKCPETKGGEGPYHEKGKLLLYQWLQSQSLHVELEPYLREIKQQPDILLTINNKKIAIEYQCARITIKDIQSRNAGYKKVGITPIWILGAKQFQRQGYYHLKIDQFTKQFIQQFSTTSLQSLLYFCPDMFQMAIVQDMYMTSAGRALGKFYFNKLYQMKFTDLFKAHPLLKPDLYQLWKKEKRKFRLGSSKRLYGKDLAWRQWLYLQQIHLEHLPSVIHLPISTQYFMKTPPWDWQSRLYIGIIDPILVGNGFSLKQSMNMLRQHLYKKSHFPLIKSTENPIQQYFVLLEQLKVIKQQSPGHFIKLKSISFHNHVEEALISDDQIMDVLILHSKNKIRA